MIPRFIKCRPCPICGNRIHIKLFVIFKRLALAWNLNQSWRFHINNREGTFCLCGGVQPRIQTLSKALANTYAWSLPLRRGLKRLPTTKIAEINACGSLHQVLRKLPHVAYSEYIPKRKGTGKEDITNLSYTNNSFDCAIHSETIEHVAEPLKAFSEIYRILKPGGYTIFTIPIIADGRTTKQRAKLDINRNLVHIDHPSYHGLPWARKEDYLVFWEFGSDIIPMIESIGFSCELFPGTNPADFAITAQRTT
jgi:SAM-dependent methyltransferase